MAYGYHKVVQSGTLVEEYLYERTIVDRSNIARKPRKRYPPQPRTSRNIRSCRRSFSRLVRANLTSQSVPYLVTLTMRDIVSIDEAWEAHRLFGKRMRTAFKNDNLKWISVPEFQKRGAVHFHMLLWNLPHEAFKSERRTRRIAGIWSFGFVDIVKTDGSPKLSTYLSKYMSKAMHDFRLVGKRAYNASRNVLRPVSLVTPFSIETAFGIWGIGGVDNPPCDIRVYATMHLGRCIYKQFIIEDKPV